MQVVVGRPPLYDEICRAFPPAAAPDVVFTWGHVVYVSVDDDLPFDLLAHEEVHAVQQAEAGGPEKWWRRYIGDAKFRLHQEIHAYRRQFQVLSRQRLPRSVLLTKLSMMARHLASPVYGSIITEDDARKAIAT